MSLSPEFRRRREQVERCEHPAHAWVMQDPTPDVSFVTPDMPIPVPSRVPLPLACLLAFLALTASPTRGATLTTWAGSGIAGFTGDGGKAIEGRLNAPFGLARAADGSIWFCEYEGHVVRRVDPNGILSTVAGTGTAGWTGDDGPAAKATLNHPHEVRFDRHGNLFIADTSSHVVRRIDAETRVIHTVAGTGKPDYSGDGGPAKEAALNLPISLQLNAAGDILICDIGNHAIRRVDTTTGRISTIAGTGKAGAPADGAPIAGTPLNGPRSLDTDASGRLWVVTREGNQVLLLDPAGGRIRHVAGTGKRGNSGDNGPAREATLNGPKAIALAGDGTLYIADTENHVVRAIDPKTQIITRVAGTGQRGSGSDGDALQSALSQPHALLIDPDGTLYVSDSMNHRIRVLRTR